MVSNLKVIKLTPAIALRFFPERRVRDHSLTEYLNMIDHHLKFGSAMAFVTMDGRDVIGIGGVTNMTKGVGYVWLDFSDKVDSYKFSIIKLLKEVLAQCSDMHRLQCDVRVDNKQWVNFVKYMGFKEEGVMRKFNSDRSDSYMMALVR